MRSNLESTNKANSSLVSATMNWLMHPTSLSINWIGWEFFLSLLHLTLKKGALSQTTLIYKTFQMYLSPNSSDKEEALKNKVWLLYTSMKALLLLLITRAQSSSTLEEAADTSSLLAMWAQESSAIEWGSTKSSNPRQQHLVSGERVLLGQVKRLTLGVRVW